LVGPIVASREDALRGIIPSSGFNENGLHRAALSICKNLHIKSIQYEQCFVSAPTTNCRIRGFHSLRNPANGPMSEIAMFRQPTLLGKMRDEWRHAECQ
jgi:hypothetical protein